MRGGSAQRGEDLDLPAGLAAAGSQKARFSDSASFAAVLKTAAGEDCRDVSAMPSQIKLQ